MAFLNIFFRIFLPFSPVFGGIRPVQNCPKNKILCSDVLPRSTNIFILLVFAWKMAKNALFVRLCQVSNKIDHTIVFLGQFYVGNKKQTKKITTILMEFLFIFNMKLFLNHDRWSNREGIWGVWVKLKCGQSCILRGTLRWYRRNGSRTKFIFGLMSTLQPTVEYETAKKALKALSATNDSAERAIALISWLSHSTPR